MRYFHRTSVTPDDVLQEADRYFGALLAPDRPGPRRRSYAGRTGRLSVDVRAEGGHYTLITVSG